MSSFWERVQGIKAQQSAMQQAKIESSISKAQDFWNRVDAIKAQQSSSQGVFPSAHEMIVNSGYDPSIVAFTQSPFYNNGKGVVIDGSDLTGPVAKAPSGSGGSPGGHSAGSVYSSPVTPAQLDYLNAEIASHYGMSKETAYQEALSNTAYQRSVKDMQAAGLNPAVIYGAGKGYTADGVYSVRSASSGGGGSGGSSRRRQSKNNGKLFTTGEFYGISAAAGLVSAVISKNPNSYWIGQTVAQGFMTAANSFLRK